MSDGSYSVELPVFRDDVRRLGIGIVGTGRIVCSAHLPAYHKFGFNVVGGFDLSEGAIRRATSEAGLPLAYRSMEEMLDDPRVQVVDVATRPEDRLTVMEAALAHGKHVLAQKPLALSMADARRLVELAEANEVLFAVNVNGRWAPPWLGATRLVDAGAIGRPFAVSHLYDVSFAWTVGTHFDDMAHFGLYDYSVHWVDIALRWLRPASPMSVIAFDYRLACQGNDSHTPWGLDARVVASDGSTVVIRGIGASNTSRRAHPFTVHGTEGTLRGSVLEEDYLVLERDGERSAIGLNGRWFPDGFAGSMGELLSAIVEGRTPDNSARDGLGTLSVVLGAVESAEAGGCQVQLRPEENKVKERG